MRWDSSPSDRGHSCNIKKWFPNKPWLCEWGAGLLFVAVFCFHVSGLTFLEPDRSGLGLKSLRKGQTAASFTGQTFWRMDGSNQYVWRCVCAALCLWQTERSKAVLVDQIKVMATVCFMDNLVSSTLIVSNFNTAFHPLPIEVHCIVIDWHLCFVSPPLDDISPPEASTPFSSLCRALHGRCHVEDNLNPPQLLHFGPSHVGGQRSKALPVLEPGRAWADLREGRLPGGGRGRGRLPLRLHQPTSPHGHRLQQGLRRAGWRRTGAGVRLGLRGQRQQPWAPGLAGLPARRQEADAARFTRGRRDGRQRLERQRDRISRQRVARQRVSRQWIGGQLQWKRQRLGSAGVVGEQQEVRRH